MIHSVLEHGNFSPLIFHKVIYRHVTDVQGYVITITANSLTNLSVKSVSI